MTPMRAPTLEARNNGRGADRISPNRFLQRVLIVDVCLNAVPAMVLTVGAPWLAPWMGVSSPAVLWGAALLGGCGAVLHLSVAVHPTARALRTMSVVDCALGAAALYVVNVAAELTLPGRTSLVALAVVAFAVAITRYAGLKSSTRS